MATMIVPDKVDPLDPVDGVDSLVATQGDRMPAKWERVADAIRDMIRSGEGLVEREDGRYLPSHTQLLARRWPGAGKISYGTLRFAIGNLKATGWVENEQGIGLRVLEDHPA